MKNIYTLTLFLLIFCAPTFGQTTATVEGIVRNENTEPVENAWVQLLNTSFTTKTDNTGKFVFTGIPYGTYVMIIQKTGFANSFKNLAVDGDTEGTEITLEPEMNRLETVTVTAQKREEIIQEIPLSITSLSYEDVKESQIQNVNDLTAISPNLYAGDPGDRRTVTSIRGIVSTSYDPAVAVYIDGVNQFNLDTYITQLFDIERIEVLRGPQGTLYGRNAMGGVVNIITREPDRESSVFVEATFGDYGRKRLQAGFRAPLSDRFFFGAAALYEEREGFYTNEFTGSAYDDQQNFSGNYYLQYLISSTWDATLNFKHFSAENDGAFPLNMGIDAAFENPYTLNQNQVTIMKDNTFNTSLVLDHKGRNLNFSSQTAYQQNYRYYEDPIDADFSPLDAISIFNNYGRDWNNVKVLTQEFRFSSPTGPVRNLEWTAGSFLFYQESPTRQATRFGEDAALLGMEETNFALINTSESITKGAALFGQLNYALTKRFDLIAGLRYDFERKEQSVLGEYQRFSDPEPVFEFQKDTTAQADFTAFSPKLGLSYDLAEEKILFATYSRGFRAGGFTPLSSDPSQPPLFPYDPEFSNNFEVGSKNVFFEGKVLLNATVFYTTVRDVQVPTLVLPDAVVITRNTGELKSKGAEIELKALLLPGLKLSYDFGYTDATYDVLKVAGEGEEEDLQGNKQIFTPETTSMLALQYKKGFGREDRFEFFVRGEWKHLGEQYFDLANNLVQEPYDLYNANVGLSYSDWQISLWGRNLFDQQYISYGYDFGAVHFGNPATYGVTLSVEM